MLIGYARASADNQDLALQRAEHQRRRLHEEQVSERLTVRWCIF
jgi:DNA invertase Pin-like site-specific DNA recombinase